jgi:hypothetical protein
MSLNLRSSKDGAICPARDLGAAMALPFADTENDAAAYQRVTDSCRNGRPYRAAHFAWAGVEPGRTFNKFRMSKSGSVWANCLSNRVFLSSRVFESYDDIIDAACEAWNKLVAAPETITSIELRNWAQHGQS